MQKKVILGLTSLAILLTIGFAAHDTLVAPPVAEAAFCDNCQGNYQTAVDWGSGATCSAAFVDLSWKITNTANAYCQSIGASFKCSPSVQVTNACTYNGSGYTVDGYLEFGCATFC